MSYAEGSLFDFPLPTNNYDNNKSIFVSSPPIGVRSSSRSPWLLDLLFLFSHLFPPPRSLHLPAQNYYCYCMTKHCLGEE